MCGRMSCALKTVIGATCWSVFHMNYNEQNGECEIIRFHYVFLQNQIILQYCNKILRNLAKHVCISQLHITHLLYMCRSFLGHGTWKVKNGTVVFLSRSANWLYLSENKTHFQNHFAAHKLKYPCNISSLNTFTHTHTHKQHYFFQCTLFKILESILVLQYFVPSPQQF